MLWRRMLADVLVVIHATYFWFVVLGLVAILIGVAFRWKWVRNPWFRWIHISMIGIVVAEGLAGISCPLTVWEKQLRKGAGQVAYAGDFIGYWTHRLLFYDAERWVFTAAYTAFGLAVLAAFILAPPRWRGQDRGLSPPRVVDHPRHIALTLMTRAHRAPRGIKLRKVFMTRKRSTRRGIALGWSLVAASMALAMAMTLPAAAETCLSPFVKRLGLPEKYLYVFCVDADAKDNDFFAVVDVNPDSATFGTIINTLDLGTKGNETHHFGYTDDRSRIWAGGLFSSRIWIIDVATDPARPRIEKVLENVTEVSGRSGPHSYYALPGRMLITFLGSAVGGLPAGMAEFTNDGKFIRLIEHPSEAPYGYDVAVKPSLNRMVTSSFAPLRNYKKPLAQMDLKDFGSELVVWDFKNRQPLQVAKAGLAPLEVRWSLKPENNYGFTNCALDNSIWMFRGNGEGNYSFKKVADTGAFPADLRQSPDDKYLYVSCFGDNLIQQWDVSDPDHPKLASTVSPCVQPNMMHVTGDGKRMYVSNSLLSTLDHSGRFYVRLVHVGPDGMKVDPFFNVDLNKLPTGPAPGHDMLIN